MMGEFNRASPNTLPRARAFSVNVTLNRVLASAAGVAQNERSTAFDANERIPRLVGSKPVRKTHHLRRIKGDGKGATRFRLCAVGLVYNPETNIGKQPPSAATSRKTKVVRSRHAPYRLSPQTVHEAIRA